jgi:hypothetical protein
MARESFERILKWSTFSMTKQLFPRYHEVDLPDREPLDFSTVSPHVML